MSETIHDDGPEIRELDLVNDFSEILESGYTVNLWNTGGSVRVAEILKPGDTMGGDAPKYGYGADSTAAKALTRARDSFEKRVLDGKDRLSKEDILAADAGYMTGAHQDGTYLDAIASINEITFYQQEDEVVAQIPARSQGTTHAYGRGVNMTQALENLQLIMNGRVF